MLIVGHGFSHYQKLLRTNEAANLRWCVEYQQLNHLWSSMRKYRSESDRGNFPPLAGHTELVKILHRRLACLMSSMCLRSMIVSGGPIHGDLIEMVRSQQHAARFQFPSTLPR